MMKLTRAGLVLCLLAAGCVAEVSGGPDDDPEAGDPVGGGDGGGGSGGGSGGTYDWSAGPFGACSVYCGGGLQDRAVVCTRSDGTVVPEGLCTAPKPPAQQGCNQFACTTGTCTPQFSEQIFSAQTPTTGTVPFTVVFNIYGFSNFAWDVINFGDGTTSEGTQLPLAETFFCVTHTYTRPGTFVAGRHLIGGPPAYYPRQELTVVIQ
jgi:hypothetical protein